MAAYRAEPAATPSSAVLARLMKQTLMSEADIRSFFKLLHEKTRQKVAEAAEAVQCGECSSDDEAAPAQAPKRARRSASSAARAGPSERSIPPLEKGKLEGRSVLIPREQWPEEPCDERGGEGWSGKVASERFGTVGVTTQSIGVDGAIHNFTYHFVLEEVLRWKPLK